MPFDIELQGVYDDTKRITCTIPHWETVLKPQGQWEPVGKEQPLLIPQEDSLAPGEKKEIILKSPVVKKKRGRKKKDA